MCDIDAGFSHVNSVVSECRWPYTCWCKAVVLLNGFADVYSTSGAAVSSKNVSFFHLHH